MGDLPSPNFGPRRANLKQFFKKTSTRRRSYRATRVTIRFMPLIIDDEVLKAAGLSEQEARLEFATRLFATGKLSKVAAARLCGLDRVGFDLELGKRGIDPFGYTADDLKKDLQ